MRLLLRVSGRRHKGVTSSWLASLDTNEVKIPVFLRNSEFRLPSKSTTPLIMVAAGTGLAPFRAFIQERAFVKKKGEKSTTAHHNTSPSVLKCLIFLMQSLCRFNNTCVIFNFGVFLKIP